MDLRQTLEAEEIAGGIADVILGVRFPRPMFQCGCNGSRAEGTIGTCHAPYDFRASATGGVWRIEGLSAYGTDLPEEALRHIEIKLNEYITHKKIDTNEEEI